MLSVMWVGGLLRRRAGHLLAAIAGTAVSVALLATIGSFLASSKATMTRRSIASVPVDWQVEARPGADPGRVLQATRAQPHVVNAVPVDFASTEEMRATTGGTTQTTGAGVVVGLPPGYRATFPDEIRALAGAPEGVLVAQQTAANLHVRPGDVVEVARAAGPPAAVAVDGVVELPAADSLFQVVGAGAQAQPAAPPDNVLLVPAERFAELFGSGTVRHQVHARLDHRLPPDPAAAYAAERSLAQNLEARLAGAGLVGDALGARLDAARTDALYAQVLFVFLGLPGIVIAALLTVSAAGAGAERRARDQALLRTRGASTAQVMRTAAAESATVAVAGAVTGLAGAWILGRLLFGPAAAGVRAVLPWAAAACAAAVAIGVAAVALPARRLARSTSVSGVRAGPVRSMGSWRRWGVDALLLAGGAAVVWLTARSGYHLVLAPEGVPSVSVSYWAFAGPALLWIGAGLLSMRLASGALRHGRQLLAATLRPFQGPLSGPVTSAVVRRRDAIGRAAALLALTIAFAGSTATFNATYRKQAEVDAVLSNGADVTVVVPPRQPLDPQILGRLRSLGGVRHIETLQHRFAYVGADLQDLYGVDARTIGPAAALQDSYFTGASAKEMMTRLAAQPDGLLVAAETVRDFQLQRGDQVVLRLTNAAGNLAEVPFHFVGIVREFPTAPRDSFLVANAAYVGSATGVASPDTYLLDTGGRDQSRIAARVGTELGSAAKVTDLTAARRLVGASLTAVDLRRLTRVELAFSLLLIAGAAGLVLGLGLSERRRAFAIASALGARRRQLGWFVWTEVAVLGAAGAIPGAIMGWVLSQVLVKELTGVFDPPPTSLSVPWGHLAAAAAVASASMVVAAAAALHAAGRTRSFRLEDA